MRASCGLEETWTERARRAGMVVMTRPPWKRGCRTRARTGTRAGETLGAATRDVGRRVRTQTHVICVVAARGAEAEAEPESGLNPVKHQVPPKPSLLSLASLLAPPSPHQAHSTSNGQRHLQATARRRQEVSPRSLRSRPDLKTGSFFLPLASGMHSCPTTRSQSTVSYMSLSP